MDLAPITTQGIQEARRKADAAGMNLIIAGMMTGKQYWCAMCTKEIFGFNDKVSVQEFRVSGACQKCQDETFREIEK